MFTVGLGPVANSVFTITTMAIAVPTGIKIFNWLGTMWKGSITFATPMLFALGFITVFTIGGISGVMHAQAASDAQQQDTYFIVAHIHYVLFGGSIFALIAGIYYWFPKFTGRMYDEMVGKLTFWLVFLGMNLTFFPMHFTGLDGMPRRIYTYDANMGWEFWNTFSSAGAALLGIGMLTFIFNIVSGWIKGERASGDPWDARTLEWSISSPPPEYNFEEIPTVTGVDDWWATKRRKEAIPVIAGASEDEEHSIHLPQPSYWPIVVSVGLLIGGYGLIYHYAVAVLGIAVSMVGVYAWSFEPVNDPDEGSEH